MIYLESFAVIAYCCGRVISGYVSEYNFQNSCEKKDPIYEERKNFPVPIKIIESGNSIAAAHASDCILVNQEFKALEKASQRWVLLHECGHLAHMDVHFMSITPIICAVAACILFPTAPLFGFISLDFLAKAVISSIFERRADSYANTHATLEELEGGISFFKRGDAKISKIWEESTTLQSQVKHIFRYLSYFFQNSILTGHPTNSSRIAAIEREIEARKNRKAIEIFA